VKNARIDYVWVGGFVLAMLVALIVCLAILSGKTGATDTYYTHYDNVLGVVPGTRLFFEGYDVGQVESIEPAGASSEKRYRVTLAVEDGWPIPEGSVAWITEPSLLAAITIDIHAGEGDAILPPGSEIRGRDLQSVFTAVNSLASEVETIVQHDVRPLLEAVAEGAPRILANMEKVTADLAATSDRVATLLDDDNTGQIETMIDDLSATAENLGALTAALESSLERVDAVVTDVDALVGDNTEQVQRMLDDLSHTLDSVAQRADTIGANLESTSHNMNEFSRQIRRDPSVLVRGSSGEPEPAP